MPVSYFKLKRFEVFIFWDIETTDFTSTRAGVFFVRDMRVYKTIMKDST